MVINCTPRWIMGGGESHVCGADQGYVFSTCRNHNLQTKETMLNALKIARIASCFLATQRFCVLNLRYPDDEGEYKDGALNRCDPLAQDTTILPIRMVRNEPEIYSMRFPDPEGSQYVGGRTFIDQFAEGFLREEASDGVRHPASERTQRTFIMRSTNLPLRRAVKSRNDYHALGPNMRDIGSCLPDAELPQGSSISTLPNQVTPAGFRRCRYGGLIEKDEDSEAEYTWEGTHLD